MNRETSEILKWALVGVLVSLAGLYALAHIFRAGDPNAELARTTRGALEAAREAQEDAQSARRASSALRIVALVVGVAAPLIVAYLIYRLRERSEPTPGDLLRVLEKQRLITLGRERRGQLRGSDSRLLEETSDRGGDRGSR